MKTPLFSIIIPTYNRCDFIKIAIASVLSQTFDNFELIIIDDGSTDNTKKTVQQYFNRYQLPSKAAPVRKTSIHYHYQKNKGPAAARNKGIGLAKGKYICFLDSDDRFRTQKLETVYQYINKYPEFSVFHTEELWYRRGEILPQKKHHAKPDGDIFNNSLKLSNVKCTPAI